MEKLETIKNIIKEAKSSELKKFLRNSDYNVIFYRIDFSNAEIQELQELARSRLYKLYEEKQKELFDEIKIDIEDISWKIHDSIRMKNDIEVNFYHTTILKIQKKIDNFYDVNYDFTPSPHNSIRYMLYSIFNDIKQYQKSKKIYIKILQTIQKTINYVFKRQAN